jgi:multiple sugar transport system permease protein
VFAKCVFRGRSVLFILALLVILIPTQVIALPLLSWIQRMHLYDSLFGVMLPGITSGLGVLFFTQAFRQVPEALLEQARMEGASEFRIYWMVVPLMGSSMLTFGLIHFILSWHAHLIPLLVLHEHATLPLAMSSLKSSGLRFPQAIIMCASTLTLVPTALIFALLYRRTRSALADLVST